MALKITLFLLLLTGCYNQQLDLPARGDKKSFINLKPHSECEYFQTADGKIQGLVSTIYNEKKYLEKELLFSFIEIPLNLFVDGKSYGEIHPYKIEKEKKYRFAPVRFLYVNKDSGAPVYKAFADRIAKPSFMVASYIGKLDTSKYNPENFMYNFALLAEVEGEWTNATIKFYDNDTNHNVLFETDVKLPPFKSNSEGYKRSNDLCEKIRQDVNVPRPMFNFWNKLVMKFYNRM